MSKKRMCGKTTQLLYRKVKDIVLKERMLVRELLEEYSEAGGFSAKNLATGMKILEKMYSDRKCVKFLSFPASIVATGCRGVLKDIVKRKLADVIITTCGTLDHDIARTWRDYYEGDFRMDDVELHKKGINRLGNILIPQSSYGSIIEREVQKILNKIYDGNKKSPKELIWEFGKFMNHSSIIYWCEKNKIPVYVPAIFDGAFGAQLWFFKEMHKEFELDFFKDQKEIANIIFSAKKTGALIIGGGISKHHTIWWNQFKGGLDYGIFITTAVEYDGSLSGARLQEAISWGKLKETAKYVTIDGDATILLPLLIAAVI